MFKSFFDKSIEYAGIEENVRLGLLPTAVFGVEKTAFLFHALALKEEFGKVVLIMENESELTSALEDLKTFTSDVKMLPRLELTFFDSYAHSHQVENERLEALYALLEDESCLILTTPDALMHAMTAPDFYKKSPFSLKLGEEIAIEDLIKSLVAFGYDRVDLVEGRGQFTVRGGIVDVFAPRYDDPIRIEFFGDEIDSMRAFDVQLQGSIGNLTHVTIRPCREGLTSEAHHQVVLAKLARKAELIKDAAQKKQYQGLKERLQEGVALDEAYKILPVFVEERGCAFDFMGDALVLTWGHNRLTERVKSKYQDWQERFKEHLYAGEALAEQGNLLLSDSEWIQRLSQSRLLTFTGLKTSIQYLKFQSIVDHHFREAMTYHGKLDLAIEDLKEWQRRNYTIWIMVEGAEKTNGMLRWLEENQLQGVLFKDQKAINTQTIYVVDKGFSAGFSTDSFKMVVLTERELYGGQRVVRKRPVKNAKTIKAFTDLSLGDYIVHEAHGIGQYQGVSQLSVDGQKKDFLKITYKGDDVLYVPVEKMTTLQKYIGSDVMKVRMNKLGSAEWKLTKAKAKKAVEDMTDELLALYAEREKRKGFAYSQDSAWQSQFEENFPYQETPDQLRCIEEIKRDMELPKPMDRLLCGDVGYGKTEVAMRAIFKAVNDSKQVAVLVPTTILAQQHFNTMVHRFSTYPVKVGVLSRFRSKREIEAVLDGLRTGVYDVVIGTHRLLSNDVQFKDLGLLVVDEEQRFGVKHKEKIKQLKSSVDVLALSATPIPRTLHMSLVGVRDMSLIEDPPEDRYPIQTYVLDYQEHAMREAILREIDRRGQVYFVHNRVEDIQDVTAKLIALVPEARVVYAHGQMNEHALEKVMFDFMNHEFDVLVSTTIIETGLDISNVNTIIINHSDRFGLSQLYQLRGRVGRSDRLAYAYLTYQKQKVLSEVSEKRLRAIKEFTDLGSGFKIAMRDLEIRGAGNLLGSQQHGHLASVGYEMFCQLVEEAVRTIKGEEVAEVIDTSIELPCEAYIPEFYIQDSRFKIDLYKKISSIRHGEDRQQILDELFDLYGTIPQSVLNLISIGYIRSMAMKMGFEKVTQKEGSAILLYSQNTKVSPILISLVLEKYNEREIKLIGAQQSWFELSLERKAKDAVFVLKRIVSVLETFIEIDHQLKAEKAKK